MEATNTNSKNLERAISQKALNMSNSTSCKTLVLGFFCGVCITYFFLVGFTPFTSAELGWNFKLPAAADNCQNSTAYVSNSDANSMRGDDVLRVKLELSVDQSNEASEEERVDILYSAWTSTLDENKKDGLLVSGIPRDNIPNAPHLENCRQKVHMNKIFDSYHQNGSSPNWPFWQGLLGLNLLNSTLSEDIEDAHPPWVVGSDEDNFPLTRKVQRDLWVHQHPLNCYDPNLRFLVADWETIPGFGMGAQFASMTGLLAIAINEERILVTNFYNRADHSGCKGSSQSRWSCYFFPETSSDCQKRAFDLLNSQEAIEKGIVTTKENYTSKQIWAGHIPRLWGRPWTLLQPTTDVNGSLLKSHRKMDTRWWRAQAIRYLMRFPSEYMCHLLNTARHRAFGLQAAKMVSSSLPANWPKVALNRSQADAENLVWSNYKPWMPRPLLSMHVRMGDKACEMKVVGFDSYMKLADRLREHFPNLNSIWLSTEMQEVIDRTALYPKWKFYYTNVTRQVGNITMAKYEASLGRETSTNYPLVNYIMATESDFFIGALGSTWCYLIDGMRNTGGKVMAGYLSVNLDRFW